MGLLKEKQTANQKCFDKIRDQFSSDIWSVIDMDNVPPSLIKNCSIHKLEREERVEIAVVDNKRQITAVFAYDVSGKFLPMWLIYKGTTKNCLPKLNNILFVTVPNNYTDRLQPLDQSVNKLVKDFVQIKFYKWYGGQICKQLDDDLKEDVDVRISIMKQLQPSGW